MRIGIDARCFVAGKRTGVEEYALNILENLFELDEKNEYILFINSFHDPNFDLKVFEKYKNVSLKRFRIPNKLLNLMFWYFNWPHIDKMIGGVDVFFMPNMNFVGFSKKIRLILTMHDLSFEILPETFSVKRRLWHHILNPRRLCRRAEKIIAVSESTREDIILRYKISPEKIQKIYNGISNDFEEVNRNDPKIIEVKDRYHLPFNFIFYLGTIEPRKNIPTIVAAYDRLRELGNTQLDKYKLVIAGGKGWKTEKILEAMRNAKFTDDIIFTSCITSEDKAAVYTLASLFVYPSFLEGFGIPVLEAMRCGVPVVTSNSSSIPEVVGNGGIMVDPDRPDELYLAMKELLLNKDFYEKMRKQGLKQSIRFNWKTSAREVLKIFEKMSKNKA